MKITIEFGSKGFQGTNKLSVIDGILLLPTYEKKKKTTTTVERTMNNRRTSVAGESISAGFNCSLLCQAAKWISFIGLATCV